MTTVTPIVDYSRYRGITRLNLRDTSLSPELCQTRRVGPSMSEHAADDVGAGDVLSNQEVMQRRELNNQLPAVSPPCEILTRIFGLCRPQWPATFTRRREEYDFNPFAWLRITHVCHRWRETALRSPTLWNTVVLNTNMQGCSTTVEPYMVIIGRAATTPLRLQVLGYNMPQKIMDIVLSYYPHIQSLSIESLSPAHHKLLRAAAAKDTTGTLQDVILHITASSMSFEDTMPNVQRLRSLNLSGFTIRPSWQGFSPSLIALSLSSILPSHGVYLSTDEVLQIMQHCPRLEVVELHYVVSRADPVQTPSSDPVRLDGLTMLAFSGDPLCFRWLLERLAYPSNARLHVTLLSPVVGVESSDAELGELLASKLAPRLLAAHLELDHMEENPALVVSAWVSLPEPWLPLQRPNFHTTPHIRIVLTMTAEEPAIMYANWPIQETFPFLQALKPLAGIEYIGFRLTTCWEETGLDMATFIPVVAQMPNIRVFDAPELDEKTCWLLSSRPRANLSPSSHSWPFLIFPDLERINILTPDAPNAAYLLCLVTHMMQVRKQFSAGLTELWFMPDDENPTDEMTSIKDLTDRELFPEYDEIRDLGVRCMYYNPASHHPVQVME